MCGIIKGTLFCDLLAKDRCDPSTTQGTEVSAIHLILPYPVQAVWCTMLVHPPPPAEAILLFLVLNLHHHTIVKMSQGAATIAATSMDLEGRLPIILYQRKNGNK